MKRRETPIWDELVRTDRKTLGITVRPDRSILVRAPLEAAEEKILAKLRLRRRWIWRQQEFFEKFEPRLSARKYISGETHLYLGRQYRLKVVLGAVEGVRFRGSYLEVTTPDTSPTATESVLWNWYWRRASIQFPNCFDVVLGKLNRQLDVVPIIEVRRFSRRWGSCHADGRISLNVDLIQAPKACIEYVLAHEVCHLFVPNHSPEFYKILGSVMPDWHERKHRLEMLLARQI